MVSESTPMAARMFVTEHGENLLLTFSLVSSLFLLWGFCNGMIDVMDKHFQEELHLSLAQSAWVQFAHYLGYFLMALPAGALARRFGYKGAMISGLLLVAAGGFWFLQATRIATFWAFLLGVCAIASGLAFLETVANPYTTVLGDARYAAARINLAQACNGVGWILGPIAGSIFFYSVDAQGRSTGTQLLYIPYVGIGVVVLTLAAIFVRAPVPDIRTQDAFPPPKQAGEGVHSVWSHPHFSMAVAAQFFYVAAQAGIFAFFINYITSQTPEIPANWQANFARAGSYIGHLQGWFSGWFERNAVGHFMISDKGAANLASIAFVCFLLGRATGVALLRHLRAHRILALYALLNTAVCGLIFLKLGWLSVACVFLSYFFMSIMFPTIFALGIDGLGPRTKRASAYLVMAIIGGALLPKLMGAVADRWDVSRSFMVPMACFAFIAVYGFNWPRYRQMR